MAERSSFDGLSTLRGEADREVAESGRRVSPRQIATLLRKGIDLTTSNLVNYHQQSGTYLDVNRKN